MRGPLVIRFYGVISLCYDAMLLAMLKLPTWRYGRATVDVLFSPSFAKGFYGSFICISVSSKETSLSFMYIFLLLLLANEV